MAVPRCAFCGGPIVAEHDYRQVVGWERRRSAGGTNAIRLRANTDQWACFRCVDKQAAGVAVEQTELIL
jgi:hypothetical protein